MSLKNISLVGRWPALLSRGLSGIISHRQPLCMAVAVQHYSYVDLLIHGVEIAMAGRCTGTVSWGEGLKGSRNYCLQATGALKSTSTLGYNSILQHTDNIGKR